MNKTLNERQFIGYLTDVASALEANFSRKPKKKKANRRDLTGRNRDNRS
jgi:hypothetical protein